MLPTTSPIKPLLWDLFCNGFTFLFNFLLAVRQQPAPRQHHLIPGLVEDLEPFAGGDAGRREGGSKFPRGITGAAVMLWPHPQPHDGVTPP